MDFSWVRQLADQSNQQELARQERIRKEREDKKTVALATNPFVEKLHLVVNGASEEYNKHCMFGELRITTSKLYKHSKTGEAPTAEPDEVSYFTFFRKGYMYGIRGVNGVVEFIEVPVGDISSAMSIRLHEMGVTPSRQLLAELDGDSKKIRWSMGGIPMDGPAIISLCQKFFIELIQQTNETESDR